MEVNGLASERTGSMGFRKKKTLRDQAADIVDSILPTIESAVDSARERAVPLLNDARDKAGPMLNDARESARPYLAQGKAIASEKAAMGAALVAEKAATGRDLAAAKVAELTSEPPKKKGGKLKKILLVTGVAGLAAFAYKKLTASDDSWQSAYTPAPPPPRPTAAPAAPAAAPVTADDQAAASPDEALADAVDEPHDVSTPDDPAEVVDIDESGSHKA